MSIRGQFMSEIFCCKVSQKMSILRMHKIILKQLNLGSLTILFDRILLMHFLLECMLD